MLRRGLWNSLFVFSAVGLGVLFLFLVVEDANPPWKRYQKEYYKRLGKVTGDPAKKGAALQVRQIYLPEFHRVDRCVTCHLGIDNPKMINEPQPFTSHPDLGIPGFLEKHSFAEIGCTLCHQGQGPATTVIHAHGKVGHWEEPLLEKGLTVGNCASCHQDIRTLKGAEPLVKARALFDQKGCIGCHSLHGWGNPIAPELAETAAKGVDQFDFRHVKGEHAVIRWIVEHFENPQAVTPGDPALGIPESAMPNYDLTEEEVKILTALTLSFAAEEEKEGHPIPARFRVAAPPLSPEPTYASTVEKGKAVYERYGCAGCHGMEGRGGIYNKGMDQAEEVPPLIYVAQGFTRESLKETIREGRFPARASSGEASPPLWMPAWKGKISEDELEALADYLMSLSPSKEESDV